MNTGISITLTAVAILASTPALAASVDFEGFEDGVYMAGTDFSGLSFDQDIQIGSFDFLDGPATDGKIARQFKKTGQFTSQVGGSIGGVFAQTVSSLMLGAGDVCCDVDNIILTGFDADGAIVDTDTFSGAASGFLSISGSGIASFFLQITDVNETGSSGFDNITFDVENLAAVPIPATFPLLAFGLGGLLFVSRRKA